MPKPDGIFNGTPVWIDLSTSDIERARTFYSGLFGWDAPAPNEEFGGYTMMTLGGKNVAGAMPKGPDEANIPDAWTIYLASDDAAASVAAAKEAGGAILMEAMEVGDFGQMAIVADPAGAVFGLWQPNAHTGFEVVAEANAPVWFELLTRDYAASTSFYTTVFGIPADAMETDDENFTYATYKAGGEDRMGVMDASQGVLPDGIPSVWTVYFGVNDTDATVARAQELGGSVISPPADTPFGRFAMLTDPTGATFSVISVQND